MSEGAWITMATAIGGGFGTLIVAIIKAPWKNNGTAIAPDPKKCPAHSGLVSDIGALRGGIERIEKNQSYTWDAIDEMRTDIKELLQR